MNKKEILIAYKNGKISTEELKRQLLAFNKTNEPDSGDSPLSENQKGLWVLQKMFPEVCAYNVPLAFHLKESLDKDTFQQACAYLLLQYPILRTVIKDKNGEPCQTIEEKQKLSFTYENIAHLTESDIVGHLNSYIKKPFRLDSEPLIRVYLFQRSDEHFIALFNIHHVIFDGASAVILLQTLLDNYRKLEQGEKLVVDPSQTNYKDFVQYEHNMLEGEKGRKQCAFWRQLLSGDLPDNRVPSDQPASKVQSFKGATKVVKLDDRLARQLSDLAKAESVSLLAMYLALYKIFLAFHSKQDDVLVSMATTGRPQRRFDHLIGYFTNMMMVRTELDKKASIKQLLNALKFSLADSLDNAEYPFSKLVNELSLKDGQLSSPLLQTSFAFQNIDGFHAISEEFEWVDGIHQEGEYAFAISIYADEHKAEVHFNYNVDLFFPETVDQLASDYICLAEKVAEDPTVLLSEYEDIFSERQSRSLTQDELVQEKSAEQNMESGKVNVEQGLCDIIEPLLDEKTVGLDDNFFDLGITSMLIIKIVEQLREKLNFSVEMVDLFTHPTVRNLAAFLSTQQPLADNSCESEDEKDLISNNDDVTQKENIDDISDDDIAIIGVACHFPKSPTVEDYWNNLSQGKECIHFFTDEELRQTGVSEETLSQPDYVKAKGVIEGIADFDAEYFNFSPREASLIDPQQRLFLELCHEALEDAAYVPSEYDGKIGLFAGSGMSVYYAHHIANNPELQLNPYQVVTGNGPDFLCSRVAYKLNLTGPIVTVQTACSTSLTAVHQAVESLQKGQSNIAMAGGVSLGDYSRAGYQKVAIASPDGHCRPFDAKANGTALGQGAGVVVLKRLKDAIEDRDNIYAVIKGSAINNDGTQKAGFTAPGVAGQEEVIRMAQARAGVAASDISYIEAHGTATAMGDPIEFTALSAAFNTDFQQTEQARQYCAIGSAKGNCGHLDAAAGVAGLIKTTLCLKHQQLVPSLNYHKPNPQIDFENSPFYVNVENKEWKVAEGKTRLAGVSSFGIGGSNVHVVMEEFNTEKRPVKTTSSTSLLFPLSAKTSTALKAYAIKLSDYLAQQGDSIHVEDLAYSLQLGREAMASRVVFIANSLEQLQELLENFSRDEKQTDRIFVGQDLESKTQNKADGKILTQWLKDKNFKPIAEEWVSGGNVRWRELYGKQLPYRISLPTYPFQKEKHWIPRSTGQENIVSENNKCEEQAQKPSQQKPKAESLPKSLVMNLADLEPQHTAFIDDFSEKYGKKTAKSKQSFSKYRKAFVDQRSSAFFNKVFKEIHYLINYEKAEGSQVWDEDGNQYIDMSGDFGVNLFGHQAPFIDDAIKKQMTRGNALSGCYDVIGEAAHLFCDITGHDCVNFCQSGTEAVMSALRIARAASGKNKVILFEGSYHGHSDGILSGLSSRVPGVLEGSQEDFQVLPFDSQESLSIIEEQGDSIAAVLVEPVQSQRPDVQPEAFLKQLREITQKQNVILIFDEMITGFRVHPKGCQGLFGIQADMATYGKILVGGFTGGAIGGRRDIMNWVDGGVWTFGDDSQPTMFNTFIAGTHTQNPMKMAASCAVLKELLRQGPALQEDLNQKTHYIAEEINSYFDANKIPIKIIYFGSLFRFKFSSRQRSITEALFYYLLNDMGIKTNGNGNFFLTTAHSSDDIEKLIVCIKESLEILMQRGFIYDDEALVEKEEPQDAVSKNQEPEVLRNFLLDDIKQITQDVWELEEDQLNSSQNLFDLALGN